MTISGIYYIIPDITINRKDEQMKDQTTEKLLDLISELINLVKTNTDNINKLAHEVAKLKGDKNEISF